MIKSWASSIRPHNSLCLSAETVSCFFPILQTYLELVLSLPDVFLTSRQYVLNLPKSPLSVRWVQNISAEEHRGGVPITPYSAQRSSGPILWAPYIRCVSQLLRQLMKEVPNSTRKSGTTPTSLQPHLTNVLFTVILHLSLPCDQNSEWLELHSFGGCTFKFPLF